MIEKTFQLKWENGLEKNYELFHKFSVNDYASQTVAKSEMYKKYENLKTDGRLVTYVYDDEEKSYAIYEEA